MCTVTSHLAAGRLLVTMNRDEYRSRAPEQPPTVQPAIGGGPPWIAPIDGQAGGTWMGANACGLVACLLNAYEEDEAGPPAAASPHASRGQIIPALLSQGTHVAAGRWLNDTFDPSQFHPFTLILASPTSREVYHHRDRSAPSLQPLGDDWQMLTSSSWNAEEVLPWRRLAFNEWVAAEAVIHGELPTYHLLQPEGRAKWSPLMSREETATRSITQAAVDATRGKVILRYWASPDLSTGGTPANAVISLDLI